MQKYLTLTNHQYNPQSVIISKKVWDTLSAGREEDHRRTPPPKPRKYQRQVSARAGRRRSWTQLKKAGMQVTELPPAEQAKLREKMKPVIDKHGASVGEATVQGAAGRAGQAAQVNDGRRPRERKVRPWSA